MTNRLRTATNAHDRHHLTDFKSPRPERGYVLRAFDKGREHEKRLLDAPRLEAGRKSLLASEKRKLGSTNVSSTSLAEGSRKESFGEG